MKIKSWLAGLKRWTTKALEWMATDGADKGDDWWRYNGGFPPGDL